MAGIAQFIFKIIPGADKIEISPGTDKSRPNAFRAAEGYAVDPVRLGLHIKALNYLEAHPEVDYPTALNFAEAEGRLCFSEMQAARVADIHGRAVAYQTRNPNMDYLKAIAKIVKGGSNV